LFFRRRPGTAGKAVLEAKELMSTTQIIKGLLTFVVPRSMYSRHTGGTDSARYCYSVFLRHLVQIHAATGSVPLRRIAELGPGDSLGVGLAALIAGAERYYAFDVAPFSSGARNLRVFDELVDLFRQRADLPGRAEIPEIKPAISDERFPVHILNDERMARALEPARIAALRLDLTGDNGGKGDSVSYVAPWFDPATIQNETLDWIFSQAVMEHVDDLNTTYEICYRWLKPGGLMSHQIDFRSHGTAPSWDGHRAYGDAAWWMVRGARPYLINRQPLSAHRTIPQAQGFEVIDQLLIPGEPTVAPAKLAPRFRSWSAQDISTSGAFVLQRKPVAG
jgi:SAM-dependent methyltransferase